MASQDTFRVERSTVIAAPAATIFPFVENFHQWELWSPFEKLDPVIDKTYSGPERGVGAVYEWSGKKAGAGRMEVTTATPSSRILIDLQFSRPFKAHNTADFSFEPTDGGTRVTWAMTGPATVMSKVMGLFFSMDKMIGKDFAEGLANLKSIAEAKVPA